MTDLISRVKKALEYRNPCIVDHVNGSNYASSLREHGTYVEHARTEKLVAALVKFVRFAEQKEYRHPDEILALNELKDVLEEMEKK